MENRRNNRKWKAEKSLVVILCFVCLFVCFLSFFFFFLLIDKKIGVLKEREKERKRKENIKE